MSQFCLAKSLFIKTLKMVQNGLQFSEGQNKCTYREDCKILRCSMPILFTVSVNNWHLKIPKYIFCNGAERKIDEGLV